MGLSSTVLCFLAFLAFFIYDLLINETSPSVYFNYQVLLVLLALGLGRMKLDFTMLLDEQTTKVSINKKLKSKILEFSYLINCFGTLVSAIIIPFLLDTSEICLFSNDIDSSNSIGCTSNTYFLSLVLIAIVLVVMIANRKYFKSENNEIDYDIEISNESDTSMSIDEDEYIGTKIEYIDSNESNFSTLSDNFVSINEKNVKLIKFLVICISISIYWMLYDQNMSEWQNQYKLMNGTWLEIFGIRFSIPHHYMDNLNSVLVPLSILVLNYFVYPRLNSSKFTLMHKMIIGYVITILAFVYAAVLQKSIENSEFQINGAVQLPQWILMSLGEALFGSASYMLAFEFIDDPTYKLYTNSLLLFSNGIGDLMIFAWESLLVGFSTVDKLWFYIYFGALGNTILVLCYFHWFYKTDEKKDLEKVDNISFSD